jgi:hypothetical protein
VATNFFGAFLLTHLLQHKACITSLDKSIYIYIIDIHVYIYILRRLPPHAPHAYAFDALYVATHHIVSTFVCGACVPGWMQLIETAPSRVVWMSSYSESWGQLHWDGKPLSPATMCTCA